MIRRIIEIDEEKCNGCGICATACHGNRIGAVCMRTLLFSLPENSSAGVRQPPAPEI